MDFQIWYTYTLSIFVHIFLLFIYLYISVNKNDYVNLQVNRYICSLCLTYNVKLSDAYWNVRIDWLFTVHVHPTSLIVRQRFVLLIIFFLSFQVIFSSNHQPILFSNCVFMWINTFICLLYKYILITITCNFKQNVTHTFQYECKHNEDPGTKHSIM